MLILPDICRYSPPCNILSFYRPNPFCLRSCRSNLWLRNFVLLFFFSWKTFLRRELTMANENIESTYISLQCSTRRTWITLCLDGGILTLKLTITWKDRNNYMTSDFQHNPQSGEHFKDLINAILLRKRLSCNKHSLRKFLALIYQRNANIFCTSILHS